MPLVSGDGPNAQKAVPNGKGGMKVLGGRFAAPSPAPGSGSKGSGGAGSSGSRSAEPSRFEGQPARKLLPYDYFKEWTTTRTLPAPSASAAKPGAIRGTLADSADITAMMGGSTISAPPGHETPIPDELVTDKHRKKVERGSRKSYEMTWDQYQALTDRQRGAVDFNTMLVSARQQDLKSQDEYAKLDDTTKATYDKAVRRMFGEEGGSDTYAPRTMAELRRIDFDGKEVGADLDQFLSLELAIDTDDLDQFKVDSKESGAGATGAMAGVIGGLQPGNVTKIQDAVLDGMRDLTETLAKGNQMLQGFRQTMARDVGVRDDLKHLGGIDMKPARMVPGFRPGAQEGESATIDDYFRSTLDALSLREGDYQTSFADLNARLKPEEIQLFGNYVDAVTRNAEMYDGTQKRGNKQYRSAAEIRALVGLDKGE